MVGVVERGTWNRNTAAEGSVAGAFWVFKRFQQNRQHHEIRAPPSECLINPGAKGRKALLCVPFIHIHSTSSKVTDFPEWSTIRGLLACGSTATRRKNSFQIQDQIHSCKISSGRLILLDINHMQKRFAEPPDAASTPARDKGCFLWAWPIQVFHRLFFKD